MTSGWSPALSEPHQSRPRMWRCCFPPPRLQCIPRHWRRLPPWSRHCGYECITSSPSETSWQSSCNHLTCCLSHPHGGVSTASLLSSSPMSQDSLTLADTLSPPSALTSSRPLPCLSGVFSPIQSPFELQALTLIFPMSPGAHYLSVPLSPVLSAASQLASPQCDKSHSDFKRIHMSSPSLYTFPTLVFQPSFFKKSMRLLSPRTHQLPKSATPTPGTLSGKDHSSRWTNLITSAPWFAPWSVEMSWECEMYIQMQRVGVQKKNLPYFIHQFYEDEIWK